jgi:tetratricopeptide (TPR) repeat protein
VVGRRTRIAAWVARSSTIAAVGGSIAIGLMVAAAPSPAAFIAMCAAIPSLAVVRKLAQRELARLPEYQADAHARGDADALAEVRRVWTSLGGKGRRANALAKLLEGEELALRERWKDARDAFVAVDRAALPAAHALNVENWIAYATAQAGDPLGALAIIDEAIAATDDASRPHLEQTRARVLVLLGRPREALAFLEESVNEAVHDRALNQRYYWLGVANDGLGNDDAARHAYDRAASLDGPYQEKAREALGSRTPFRG